MRMKKRGRAPCNRHFDRRMVTLAAAAVLFLSVSSARATPYDFVINPALSHMQQIISVDLTVFRHLARRPATNVCRPVQRCILRRSLERRFDRVACLGHPAVASWQFGARYAVRRRRFGVHSRRRQHGSPAISTRTAMVRTDLAAWQCARDRARYLRNRHRRPQCVPGCRQAQV